MATADLQERSIDEVYTGRENWTYIGIEDIGLSSDLVYSMKVETQDNPFVDRDARYLGYSIVIKDGYVSVGNSPNPRIFTNLIDAGRYLSKFEKPVLDAFRRFLLVSVFMTENNMQSPLRRRGLVYELNNASLEKFGLEKGTGRGYWRVLIAHELKSRGIYVDDAKISKLAEILNLIDPVSEEMLRGRDSILPPSKNQGKNDKNPTGGEYSALKGVRLFDRKRKVSINIFDTFRTKPRYTRVFEFGQKNELLEDKVRDLALRFFRFSKRAIRHDEENWFIKRMKNYAKDGDIPLFLFTALIPFCTVRKPDFEFLQELSNLLEQRSRLNPNVEGYEQTRRDNRDQIVTLLRKNEISYREEAEPIFITRLEQLYILGKTAATTPRTNKRNSAYMN